VGRRELGARPQRLSQRPSPRSVPQCPTAAPAGRRLSFAP
jgi:hypothetical protein